MTEFVRQWRSAGMAVLLAGVIILAGVAVRAQSGFACAGDPSVPMSERLVAARDAATLEPFMSDYAARFAILAARDLASRGDLDKAQRVLVDASLADGDDALLSAQLQGVNLALQERDATGDRRIHSTGGPNDVVPASVSTP